jgi:hypothetical protein
MVMMMHRRTLCIHIFRERRGTFGGWEYLLLLKDGQRLDKDADY